MCIVDAGSALADSSKPASPMGSSPMDSSPEPGHLQALLDHLRPATVLACLKDNQAPVQAAPVYSPPVHSPPMYSPPCLAAYRAEALIELDRSQEALECLEPALAQMEGADFAYGGRVWAQIMLRMGLADTAVLIAQKAAQMAEDTDLQAVALAWSAVGYAQKHCWRQAEQALRHALELAPDQPRLLAAQARFHLEADERIEARRVYERMARLATPAVSSAWAQAYAEWGQAYIAYLLGQFDQAVHLAKRSLSRSEEIIQPLFVLSQVAQARQLIPDLEYCLVCLEQRSPQAESLAEIRQQLYRMNRRKEQISSNPASLRRLAATREGFPTLVQRRNSCGPSTVELVLRYWQGEAGAAGGANAGGRLEWNSDTIAEKIKLHQAGTPIYRMREFFHLIGFDTVRTLVPVDQLKELVRAGYPVIIQEEFSNTSHVAVVIGFDEIEGIIELQDPMTHVVTPAPVEVLNRLRAIYQDSAIIAFPRNQGHAASKRQVLAHLNLFDHPVIVASDQASLELDQGRPQAAAGLMEKAVKSLPSYGLAWILLLNALMDLWRSMKEGGAEQEASSQDKETARQRFRQALKTARRYHPQAEFIYQFEGSAALLENDPERALKAFQKAAEIDPADARNYALQMECFYALRQLDAAIHVGWQALHCDPALAMANVWMGRCLALKAMAPASWSARLEAMHFIQAGLELAPDWWLAHLVMAEIQAASADLSAAILSVEQAWSLSPGQPEVELQRAALKAALCVKPDPQAEEAAAHLQQLLEQPQTLTPATLFRAYQALARVRFSLEQYGKAVEIGGNLLDHFPHDHWGLQFLAAAQAEAWLQAERNLDETGLAQFKALYDQALQANPGENGVVVEYLHYLEQIAGPEVVLEEMTRLQQAAPQNGALLYLLGLSLDRLGHTQEAVQAFLQALGCSDGVRDRDELTHLIEKVITGLGMRAGEQAVLAAPLPEGSAPLAERLRALGLVLAASAARAGVSAGAVLPATTPEVAFCRERAQQLLQEALERDVQDALVALRLGDVTLAEEEREAFYRQALMIAPDWDEARAVLADTLIECFRPAEALEYTSGYETHTVELLTSHGRALLGVGRFEEAVDIFSEVIQRVEQPHSWHYALRWQAEKESGLHEAALATARRGLKLFQQDLTWYLRLSASLCALDRLDEARRVLARGRAAGLSEADVLREEVEISWLENNYEAVMEILNELFDLGVEPPGEGLLSWSQGRLVRLLVTLERFTEARRFLVGEHLNAQGWAEASQIALEADQPAFALELAERALSQDAENLVGLKARFHALQALQCKHRHRQAEAQEALELIRRADPQEHTPYEYMALWAVLDGNQVQAIEFAERAVNLGAFCAYAWAVRGLLQFLSGHPEEALADLLVAWNRSSHFRRERMPLYGWLLAALQENLDAAEMYRQQVEAQSTTSMDRRLFEKILALRIGPS